MRRKVINITKEFWQKILLEQIDRIKSFDPKFKLIQGILLWKGACKLYYEADTFLLSLLTVSVNPPLVIEVGYFPIAWRVIFQKFQIQKLSQTCALSVYLPLFQKSLR